MVINNTMKCVGKTKLVEWNGNSRLYCDVTGLHPLDRVFSRKKIGMEEISILINAIGILGEEVKKNMLDLSDFLFSPDMIFWNLSDNSVRFVFYPDAANESDMTYLAQFLLEHVDNDEPNAVKIAYDLYKNIREGFLDTESLYELFKSDYIEQDSFITGSKERDEFKENKTISVKDEQIVNLFAEKEVKRNLFQKIFRLKNQDEIPEYEDDPIDLSGYGEIKEPDRIIRGEETVLVNIDNMDKYFCIVNEDGKETEISKEGEVIAGSKKEYVDIYIDNSSVSKMHAQFAYDGECMRLTDLSSLNGTRVNSVRIDEEAKLSNKDIIEFGTTKYEFVCKYRPRK